MNRKDSKYWIQALELSRHPEGGHYRETYRSAESVPAGGLPPRFPAPRAFSTAIYYLLEQGEVSAFHRLKSDEIFHFYQGGSLSIWKITSDARLEESRLGENPAEGESLQVIIPAGSWFGAEVRRGSYCLAGCTVSPGFSFEDFEMAPAEELSGRFPAHREIIFRLSKGKRGRES